jgi:hypothetical protein
MEKLSPLTTLVAICDLSMLDPLSNDLRECNEIDDGLLSKERVLFT